METKQLHSVDKIHVRVHTHSEENGHYLKDNVGEWIRTDVLPYLENYFAELEKELDPQTIRFDQLKISLDMEAGKLKVDNIHQHVLDQIEIQIRPLLKHLKNPDSSGSKPEGNIIDAAGRETEAFFYFLKTGRAPWWIQSSVMDELLGERNLSKLISKNKKQFYKQFLELIASSNFNIRLIRQFSGKVLYKILNSAFSAAGGISVQGTPSKLLYILDLLSHSQKERFWLSVIQMLLAYRNEKFVPAKLWEESFEPILKRILSAEKKPSLKEQKNILRWLEELTSLPIPSEAKNNLFLDVIEKHYAEKMNTADPKADLEPGNQTEEVHETFEEENNQEELQGGLIVENAGLILLHPFLKSFFVKTALLDDQNGITDPDLAVHILHYIATGKQQDWDHNLLFEKFLCNIPLSHSIVREVIIPSEILDEVDLLLQAVLENWEALRTSSKELLRNEFLQRPGKLFIDDISVRLTIERKTHDLLLDRLPWNISMVKLPWHRHLTYTTW